MEEVEQYARLQPQLWNRIIYLLLLSIIVYLGLDSGRISFALIVVGCAIADLVSLLQLARKARRIYPDLRSLCEDYEALSGYKFFHRLPPSADWTEVRESGEELLASYDQHREEKLFRKLHSTLIRFSLADDNALKYKAPQRT